jgi:hypothetical protein
VRIDRLRKECSTCEKYYGHENNEPPVLTTKRTKHISHSLQNRTHNYLKSVHDMAKGKHIISKVLHYDGISR